MAARIRWSEPEAADSHLSLMVIICIAAGLVLVAAYIMAPTKQLSGWGMSGAAVLPASNSGTPLIAAAEPDSGAALQAYIAASQLHESVGGDRVQFLQRDVAGGTLYYIVVALDGGTAVRVINADGATPGSDGNGDTIWLDGQAHLQPVQVMVNAPYAARDGAQLLGALAFGFHGDVRTSDEGSIVIDSQVLRVNPGRAALCVKPDHSAVIGLFDQAALGQCAQAIGGGPVILLNGKVANPDVAAPSGEYVPFNPLNEDFVQLDWRRKVYQGAYPKTAVGIGRSAQGHYLVLAASFGMTGVDLARQLQLLGCNNALGGDDDSSTQLVWRGVSAAGSQRPVPDALAVYLTE